MIFIGNLDIIILIIIYLIVGKWLICFIGISLEHKFVVYPILLFVKSTFRKDI